MKIAIALLFTLTLSLQTSAATIRVPQDQATIQAGIGAAVNGDTVLVESGVYLENIDFLGKRLLVTSTAGPDQTTIQALDKSISTVTLALSEPRGSTLRGFTITGSDATAIKCVGSSPIIENNIITGNKSANGNAGAGISLSNTSNSTIRGNKIHANQPQTYAGAISIGNDGVASTNDTVCQNLIYDNTGYHDIRILGPVTGLMLLNNTIAGTAYSAVYNQGTPSITALNNIICHCPGVGMGGDYPISNNYNCFFANATNLGFSGGSGNVFADALFVDYSARNFNLQSTSPCINAGDPNPIYNDPDGSRNDMGALSSGLHDFPFAGWINYGQENVGNVVRTLTPTIYWTYVDTSTLVQSGYEIEIGTDADWVVTEMWQPGPRQSSDTSTSYAGLPLLDHHSYYLRLRVSNGLTWGEWSYSSFMTSIFPVIHVPQDQPTIQAGINAAENGDTVLVGPGVYTENIYFGFKNIVLKSELGREQTTIHALDVNANIITIAGGQGTACIVEGFKITGTTNGWGVYINYSDPQILACEVSYCAKNDDGGGIYVNTSGGRIRDCLIHHNQSGITGGGIVVAANQSSKRFRIEKNRIYENTAPSGPGIGCTGVSGVDIAFNTIYENIGSGSYDANSGGIYVNGADCKIWNNTVAGNTKGITLLNGSGIDVRNNVVAYSQSSGMSLANATSAYNDVWMNGSNNLPGTNGIVLDPIFVDTASENYSITQDSPCINAGDPDPVYNDPDGSRNDIGAYYCVRDHPWIDAISIVGEDSLHVVTNVPTIAWHCYDVSITGQVAYEIQVGTDSDWMGAEYWASGEVVSSDTMALYGGIPIPDGSLCFCRIRVSDSSGWGGWRSFRFRMNSRPSAPLLRQPLNNEVVPSANPTLTFKKSYDAQNDSLRYFVDLSTDAFQGTMDTWIVKGNSDTLVSFTIDSTLLDNAHYWWRVRASDYFEESEYSEICQFWVNTANAAPSPFNLLTPANAVSPAVSTITPLFSWEPAGDIDPMDLVSYFLYLSIDSTFNFIAATYELGVNQFTIANPLDWGRRYWWKVKAIDLNGGETWSNQIFRFRIMTPGDADGSRTVTVSDIVFLINYVFSGGPAPNPLASGDADCSGAISISDAVYLIQYIFSGGPMPCEG